MRAGIVAIGFVAVSLLHGIVRADEDPRRVEADALVREALTLSEKKQDAEALVRLRKAHALYPSANIVFALAVSEQATGHALDALRHYRQALRMPTLHPNNFQKGKANVKELEERLARVRLTAPAGATFTVDGTAVEVAPDEPLDLEPGPHIVEASFHGKQRRRSLDARPGKEEELAFSFDDAAEARSSGSWSTQKIVVVAGLGAFAVAGAVTALVSHAAARSAVEDAKSLPPTGDCRTVASADCARAAELKSDRDGADTRTTVGLLVAGLFTAGAVGTILLWKDGSASKGARVGPSVAPGYAGAFMNWGF